MAELLYTALPQQLIRHNSLFITLFPILKHYAVILQE